MWYAADAAACGKISDFRSWWDQPVALPLATFQMLVKPGYVVIKEQFHSHVVSSFQDIAVNVTSDGRSHLGVTIGSTKYSNNKYFVTNKVDG